MSAGATKDSAAFCAEQVRSHDFEHYASTLFVSAAPLYGPKVFVTV